MERYIAFIAVLFYFCPVRSTAQTNGFSGKDSILISEKILMQTDTSRIDSLTTGKRLTPEKFKPESKKAWIYSAIVPGLGQIYNRKYWKLPLVYGSFIACAYAITWNGNQYNGYRNAYLDFISGDPARVSWLDYRYGSYARTDTAAWTGDMRSSFSNALKSAKDYYRRYRDLSWIISVGVYAVWIIDAYVDAQLFDFDISPDLSMHIEPVLFDSTTGNKRTVGMQLSFAF